MSKENLQFYYLKYNLWYRKNLAPKTKKKAKAIPKNEWFFVQISLYFNIYSSDFYAIYVIFVFIIWKWDS